MKHENIHFVISNCLVMSKEISINKPMLEIRLDILSLTVALAAVCLAYYIFVVVKPVVLHSKDSTLFSIWLKTHLPILNEYYYPTFWCLDSRLHSALAVILRCTIKDIVYNYREVCLGKVHLS